MCDQHDGAVDLILQSAEQIEDLCLDRHIERCCRLIGDNQTRITCKRHCDHDSLAHTAGKLVRIHPVYTFLIGNADHLKHLDRTCLDVILCHVRIVKCNDLIHLLADTKYRIQGSHRLLENHGHVVAAQLLHHRSRGVDHIVYMIAGIKADLPSHGLTGWALYQLHQGKACHGFSTTGLTYDTDRLALRHIKRYTIDRLDRSDVREEISLNVVELNAVLRILHLCHIFLLRNMLSVSFFLDLLRNLAVLPRNRAGFFCGDIICVFLLIIKCHSCHLPFHLRIECITQTITDKVICKYREQDQDACRNPHE